MGEIISDLVEERSAMELNKYKAKGKTTPRTNEIIINCFMEIE